MAASARDSFPLITPAERDEALARALRLALLRVPFSGQINRMQHLYLTPGPPTPAIKPPWAAPLPPRRSSVALPWNGRRRLNLNPYCYLARHAVELGVEQEIIGSLLGNPWREELLFPRERWAKCEGLHPARLCPRRHQ